MSAELKAQFWIYCDGQSREAAIEIATAIIQFLYLENCLSVFLTFFSVILIIRHHLSFLLINPKKIK